MPIKSKISLFVGALLILGTVLPAVALAQDPDRPVVVPSTPKPGAKESEPPIQGVQNRRGPSPVTDVRPGRYVVPQGSRMEVRLAENLSSEVNSTRDEFEAILDHDLYDERDRLVAPKGSRVVGRLPEVKESGRVKGKARLSLELTEIFINAESFPLISNLVEFRAEGGKKDDAKKVGIAAGIGAVIGAIAGGGKGAAIGAAIGGGAGTTVVLATEGEEIELRKERLLSFQLDRDLKVDLR